MQNVNYESFCDKKLSEKISNELGETQSDNNLNIKRIKKPFKRKIIKILSKIPKSKKTKKKMKNLKKDSNSSSYNVLNRQDDHCNLNVITYIGNTQINIKTKKLEDINPLTNDCTLSKPKEEKPKPKSEIWYPKKRKLFGQWISHDKFKLDITKCKNSLIKQYPELLEKISNFSNNAPKFLSHVIMQVKNEVAIFGQKTINQSIINSENYQLNYLDYEKFIKVLTKEFNDRNMCKKLEELFIEFQAKNEGDLEDHNKMVIRYIRNNKTNELFANEYLDKTFYELFNLFIEKRLDDYIKEKKDELDLILKNQNNNLNKNLIKDKNESFIYIIKFICENYKEYFDLIDERKNRVKLKKIKK